MVMISAVPAKHKELGDGFVITFEEFVTAKEFAEMITKEKEA